MDQNTPPGKYGKIFAGPESYEQDRASLESRSSPILDELRSEDLGLVELPREPASSDEEPRLIGLEAVA